MDNLIKQLEKSRFLDHFGLEIYEKTIRLVEFYAGKWNLSNLTFIEYYSVNSLFACDCGTHGKSVLKVCHNSKNEVVSECNALMEFGPNKCCRLFEFDTDDQVMLIEQLIPGEQLKSEDSLERRLSVFSDLYNGLHKEIEDESIYRTYTSWVCRIADHMKKLKGHDELTAHMQNARDIYLELSSEYNRRMLLHGDFHYDNILKTGDSYRLIDVKGAVGDPVFDVPRYTLNEYCDAENMCHMERMKFIKGVIEYFEKSIHIPVEVQKKCLYVEMAMGACWSAEDGMDYDINDVRFARSLMMV